MNIRDKLENHKAMLDLATVLGISEDKLEIDDDGGFQILGTKDNPLKSIQYLDGAYFYFIKRETLKQTKATRKKLIDLGWQPYLLKGSSDIKAHLFIRRLPEGEEPAYLRKLLGLRQMRSLQSKNETSPSIN